LPQVYYFWCMQTAQLYDIYLQHPQVQTDTRKLRPGDLFFALKGDNFNGNAFAAQALEAGAAYSIVDEETGLTDNRIIRVPDVLTALQQLAKCHRQSFAHIPFVAITGSNGKTTTKELVHEVLSTTYKTYTTSGNLNNHIGIPLTLLKIKADAEMAVIEMGANHQKEIEGYCTYTLPTHGIITNCGKAHLEGFGSVEGVRKGKGELYDYLRAHNGTAFVMWDYDYLRTMSQGLPNMHTYGTTGAELNGQVLSSTGFLTVGIAGSPALAQIATHLVGEYNLPNVLVAVALGKYFKVPDEKIKAAIENYRPSNSRSQLLEWRGNKVILDAYNANPTSMRAAIENFAKMDGGNKVLLLGGMMELGEESLAEHTGIVQLIQQYPWLAVVLVGGDYANVQHPFTYFNTAAEAGQWLQQQGYTDAMLLVKGSRSMQMEKVLGNGE
jgi:UDP-N-acetylmuramoyl-tripeptide--D-alanyl-D-alanine ligase